MEARENDAIVQEYNDEQTGWTHQLGFDFNCSDLLYDTMAEEKDEDKLTLRELVLKRVYEREQAFKIRERVLAQKVQDLEAQLLLLQTASTNEDQENRKPLTLSAAKKKMPSTLDVTKTHSPLATIGDRQMNKN